GAMYYPLLSPLHSVATHRHLHSFPTRRSSDLEYLSTLIDILPKLLNDEKPDFIFYLSGVDVLGTDKLGRLNLSIDGCKERDRIVDRKSTRLNSSHVKISYAVFCLKKKTRVTHT